jgi:alkanesulfonate monooxygenase SsuD/methylene tetrahydromethanopterin reductase-like flavin-dependent oxidoreductase (luciferase family)
VTFDGEYYRFANITVEPKPAASPRPPIWIANNAKGSRELIEQTHRRVINRADGWQTSLSDIDDLRWRIEDIRSKALDAGRDPGEIEMSAYHNVNIAADRETALGESKRFIDTYYSTDVAPARAASWTAAGSPEECVEHIRALEEIGFDEVALRITSWDQAGQFRRLVDEVLPLYAERYGAAAPVAG